MRSIELYLDDMIAASDDITAFMVDVDSFAVFVNDEKTRQSVRMRLVDLGEAASKLPREFRQKYTGVEWADVVAFRNILTHQYFQLDWFLIWQAVKINLPLLRATAVAMLASLENSAYSASDLESQGD